MTGAELIQQCGFEIQVEAVVETTVYHGINATPSSISESCQLLFLDDQHRPLGRVSLARLRGDNWYEDSGHLVSDAALSPRVRRALLRDVQSKAMAAPRREKLVIDRDGFTVYHGSSNYVYHGRLLWKPPDTDLDVEVEVGNNPPPPDDHPPVSRTDIRFYVSKLLALDDSCSTTLFFISLIGPMKSILHWAGYPVEFMTCLYGPSGYMKTRRALLFFDPFDTYDSLKTLSAKKLLSQLKTRRDQNYLIDDVHPQASSYQKARQEDLIDTIVRTAQQTVGPNVVLTAEFLSGSFSVQDRQLQIAIEDRCDPIRYAYLLTNRRTMVAIHEYFMTSVMEHLSEVRATIQDWAKKHSTTYDYRCYHARDEILLMRELFCRFFLSQEEHSAMESDLTQLDQQLDRIIEKQISRLSMMQRNNDTPSDAALMIWNMLGNGVIPVVFNETEFRKSRAALFQNNKLYITLPTLRKAMLDYTGENPTRNRILVKELRELEMLDSIKDFHGHPCYVIDMEMIRQYCDSLRDPDEPAAEPQSPHL